MEASALQNIFVGREHEQQLYHDFLTHATPWVLIITGLSGIGKSTLLEHLIKDTSSSIFTCKLDFNETVLRTEPLIILQRLAQQLRPYGNAQQFDAFEQALHRDLDQIEQIRKIKLPPYTSDDANIQEAQSDYLEDDAATKEIGRQMRELSTESFYDLLNAFHLNQLVLMLDTCEWFNEPEGWEVGQWVFNELIPELRNRLWHNEQRCSVVIVSRVKPQLEGIDKQDQQYLSLSMLSEKAVYEYLERAGMHDPKLCQRIYDITHGHALSVSIIGTICQEQGEKSLTEEDFPFLQKEFTGKASIQFVDERILSRLESPYRELTRYGVLLRTFNLPLLQAVFFDMDALKGPDAPSIFDHLIRYPYIESRGNNNYAFHELLREVIAEKVQQQEGPEKEQWKIYHKHALEYFSRVAPYSPDWYYHAIASDEEQGMRDWSQAIQKASAPQIKALLQITYDSTLKLSSAACAVRDYEQGRFNYGSIEWLDATGNVQQARDKRKEALKSFENAFNNFKEAQDSCGEALAQQAIGALQSPRKVQASALKSYWQACQSTTGSPDWYYQLLGLRNEPRATLQSYEQALDFFRRVGDQSEEAKVLKAMGDVQRLRNDLDAALQCYEQCLDLFRQRGDRLEEAKVLKAMGDVQRLRQERNTALESYGQALALFGELKEPAEEAGVRQAVEEMGQPQSGQEAKEQTSPKQFSQPGQAIAATGTPMAVYGTSPSQSQLIRQRPPKARSPLKVGMILMIGLVLVLLVGSGGLIFYVHSSAPNSLNANATATAQANATAQAATNPYPPHTGSLALDDPLSNNSSNNWFEGGSSNGACVFTGGAYHVFAVQLKTTIFCPARATNFSNFAYQIQMTIIKGDFGELIFRLNTNDNFYLFGISTKGSYNLSIHSNNSGFHTLSGGQSSAINTGLSQPNLIAIIASGNKLDLYVNHQLISTVIDSTYNRGQIGVSASASQDQTEVMFSNAQVWTF